MKKKLKETKMARWLDNRLNEDERKQLEASGELDDLKVVLDDIDTWKVKEFDTEAGLADLKKRKKLVISPTPTKRRNIGNWLSIAASIFFLITGSYFSWNYFTNQTTIVNTSIAENKTVDLPGGSVIKLDALSEVSYKGKEWENNRTIHLKGQAFFDVTKGSSFKVVTQLGTVSVLGTQFNINSTDQKFEVKCYEGKVLVAYVNDEEILTKGQAVKAKESMLIRNLHTIDVPEWINGFSKYNEALLSDVIVDLEKYYKTQIKLPKKYENLQFTGTLTHKNLNTALQTLFTSMEIKYEVNKDGTVTFE